MARKSDEIFSYYNITDPRTKQAFVAQLSVNEKTNQKYIDSTIYRKNTCTINRLERVKCKDEGYFFKIKDGNPQIMIDPSGKHNEKFAIANEKDFLKEFSPKLITF